MSNRKRSRFDGSVYQRKSDQKWIGAVSLGRTEAGKYPRKVVVGKTRNEVLKKIRGLQAKVADDTLTDVDKQTAGQFLDRWLANTAKALVRANTHQDYTRIVKLHLKPILGNVKLTSLRAMNVEGLYAAMERKGATARTRRAAGTVLTIALNHAVKNLKLIAVNPALAVPKPKYAQKEMHFLNDDQAKRFLEAARDRRLYALFALALGTGLRQGELLGLKWTDIDFDKGTVKVERSLSQIGKEFVLREPKSKNSRRTVTLPEFVVDALHEHRRAMLAEGNSTAPVFCTKTGGYIAKSNLIRQVHQPILKTANLIAVETAQEQENEPALLPEIRFHDLRHSHASILLAGGHSIKAVSQRLGHASIDITLRVYAHVLPTDDAKLAEGLHRLLG